MNYIRDHETAKSFHKTKWFTLIKAALVILAALIPFSVQAAAIVDPTEMAQQDQWVHQNLLIATNPPPFSFTYGGQPSSRVLPSWGRVETDTILDTNRNQHEITWTHDDLQVRCVAVEYNDYPMVEWTVYLKNIGMSTTPILQDIQGLDISISRTNGPEFVLNGNRGDFCAADSYEPYQITLNSSTVKSCSPPSNSGKSCDSPAGWPYYNLQMPGGGIILAIGWPGEWASSFTRDAGNVLQIKAGQQLTHLVLNPGEQIRTPLIAMMFWQGTDVVRAQNLWRHWYLAHEIPKVNGQPPPTILQAQAGGADTNDANTLLQAGIKLNICWRDAAEGGYSWYPSSAGPYKGGDAWINTGTWEVDPKKYPSGFKPFSDWLHTRGVKFLLWFEPERVGDPNSWLSKNHPDWLLRGTSSTYGDILNEGNPAVFNWLTNHMEGLIISNGIDWYREDMNGGGPLPAWRNNDATNRQGITENFYVQGHLAYWDALLAMNPGLRIDSCASGGRRNDLETMRRAVPLLRSDFQFPSMANVVDGNQCHTYGLSSWLPFQGTGCYLNDPYSFRSFYLAGFGMAGEQNTAAWQQAYAECKKIAPIMLNGDYYPLTPYSLANTAWMAWQFDWPARGQGVVQAFRRGNCDEPTEIFRLSGLDPSAHYKITNLDVKGSRSISGKQLMEKGLMIEINNKPGAAVITYQLVK
jgi:alpha-galactosidase